MELSSGSSMWRELLIAAPSRPVTAIGRLWLIGQQYRHIGEHGLEHRPGANLGMSRQPWQIRACARRQLVSRSAPAGGLIASIGESEQIASLSHRFPTREVAREQTRIDLRSER